MKNSQPRATRILERFLSFIEKAGNALPHPATLFAIGAALVVLVSAWGSHAGWQAIHPVGEKIIQPVNLLTVEGFHRMLREMVKNFTGFAPLGTVLVAMLGMGIAESSGLISATMRLVVLSAPQRLLTFTVVLAGVLSNIAADVGYVVLIPLGGVIFLAVGRHPVAGLAAAFAGVSGGFSANLLVSALDPLLAGLTQEAAQIVQPNFVVNALCNYYFMIASTLAVAVAGTWVTEAIVVPRLGSYTGDESPQDLHPLTPAEKRGLVLALLAGAALTAVALWGLIPANGFLRDLAEPGNVLKSPFIDGIVAVIFIVSAVMAIAYGLGARTVRNDTDVMNAMGRAMETMGMYIVLAFFAAQFVEYFKWSNLALITAIKGAELLKASGFGPVPLMIAFILLTTIINLLIGSASAKWAILAPVFVPMFMLLGYSPGFVQAAYRVGDSVTNIISPLMAYFAVILAFVNRYDKKAGLGTVIATMLPYSVVFLILWTVLLVIWVWADWPIGPGVYLRLPQ